MRFNPRARVGRDLKKMAEQGKLTTVSIHAPVWGATLCIIFDHAADEVSIHAPVWGATSGPAAPGHETRGFNPRARVGRDVPA